MAVAALQVLDVDGDGLVLGAVQHQVGQEVVIPHPHDLQHAHGDEDGLEHGEHHREERAHWPAAVDGGGLLDGQRHALDKAREHEYRQPCAKSQVDHRNGPGGVQVQHVGRLGQREHDHLEGHDHGEHAQIVHHAGEHIIHAGNIPRGHRRADQNQRGRQDGDDKAVGDGVDEGIFAHGHAGLVVGPAHEAFGVGQGEGVGVDGGVALEGVEEHDHDGHHVRDADEHKQHGQDVLADAFTPHYCCTSLLWVARSWMSAMAATRMKNSTALAWPMPRELELR